MLIMDKLMSSSPIYAAAASIMMNGNCDLMQKVVCERMAAHSFDGIITLRLNAAQD